MTIRIPPTTRYRDLDGEAVLLQADSGDCYTLDAVANRIWQLLSAGQPLDAIADMLSQEYGTAPDVVAADVERLVRELADRRLIEVGPG